jgi:L,D-transpeptidase catalytic domain
LRVNHTGPSAPAGVPAGRGSRLLVVSTLAVLQLLAVAGAATAAPGLAPRMLPAAFRDVAGLSPRALAAALDAVAGARSRGIAGRGDLLTLIDYSLPSTAPRLWVLDLASGKVLFHELVAHGAGSGDNYATRFSNAPDSRQSSLGLFLTGGTYEGGNGYSLKLNGLDPGVNDLAEERRVVMHGAWYVSADHVQHFGRLGRSWGCPALPVASAHAVIDVIKNGTFLFSYAGGSAHQTVQAALRSARTTPAAPGVPAATPTTPATPAIGSAITAASTAITAGTH